MAGPEFDLEPRPASVLESEPTALTELEGGTIGTGTGVGRANGRTVAAKTGETPLAVETRVLRAPAQLGY